MKNISTLLLHMVLVYGVIVVVHSICSSEYCAFIFGDEVVRWMVEIVSIIIFETLLAFCLAFTSGDSDEDE